MLNVKIIFIESSYGFSKYEKYMPLLPKERQDKISKLRFDKNKILSLFSGLLMCKEASERLVIPSSEVQFTYNKYGKPSIKDLPQFYFSVSHSEECIAYVCDNSPIGIDTEKISDANLSISKRFFSPNEHRYIIESDEQNEAFYEIWTKKEAYVKLLGTGLSTPLSSFDVTDKAACGNFYTRPLSGYMFSICSQTRKLSDDNISIKISRY